MNILSYGKMIIDLEKIALEQLKDNLDLNFSEAVRLILQTKGKVILTGMGKSGLIAQKISSTLSSTGTPSFFLHPGEASHGDLGVITVDDILIAISKSGESKELNDILIYANRNGIKLIGITENDSSTLAKNSQIILLLPTVAEACHNNLAPTTSTTMTLALGDALALTVSKEKKFGKKDFNKFHPSGKLGKTLLTVESIMHDRKSVPLIKLGQSMKDAILEMTNKTFGVVGVINEENELKRIITDGDLRRHFFDDLIKLNVEHVMTKDPIVVGKDLLVSKAVHLMSVKKINCLFVVDINQPIGILRVNDCIRLGF